jgi:hypothetical protein
VRSQRQTKDGNENKKATPKGGLQTLQLQHGLRTANGGGILTIKNPQAGHVVDLPMPPVSVDGEHRNVGFYVIAWLNGRKNCR